MPAALARIVIDDLRPRAPGGHPAKAVVGEAVTVSADIFRDGHDVLAARCRWRPAADTKWATVPMHDTGNDRWEAVVEPAALGRHELVVEAWTDGWATWHHKVTAKLAAGQDVAVELEEAARMTEARTARLPAADRRVLQAAARALRDPARAVADRLAPALEPQVAELLAGPEGVDDVTAAGPFPLWVDRERALVGAWYELFPRSHGGLAGTLDRLPAVAAMGFDVVYLPPVHPIGRTHRKGPGNVPQAAPGDPGSPWAIGATEGGHTEVHPELGTVADFEALVVAAAELGLEVALDYALQCSPDHPWVGEHPEWFHHRPDGSIAYAENPPKKYQDIYPINFWPAAEADRLALWQACKHILDVWIGRGVRIFRVDNPHTKPLAFWAWVIPAVQADHPEVVFLAEAFTRPKMMARLAAVGFSQSYTYFTWRTAGWELRAYLEELAHGPAADYMRPNFWPNTPDILSGPLRNGPPPAFALRLALAATLVPSYGIYSGYELCENEPASTANEEYLYSEKYEVKRRNWDQPGSLAPLITRLNEVRRQHPAFGELRNITFHHSNNDQLLVFSKRTADGSDMVLVVVNLDPHNPQSDILWLDLDELGFAVDEEFLAHDELTGETYTWRGAAPYVFLHPSRQPAHILHLRHLP